MQNIQSILRAAQFILNAEGIDLPSQTYRDFCTLFAETIKQPKSYLYAHSEYFLSLAEYKKTLKTLKKLAKNKPIEYLRKKAIFMEKEFFVNSSVLIPRVETEILINQAQKILPNLAKKNQKTTILELGIGSGIIAIELALFIKKNNLNTKVYGIDCSKKALKIAEKNAKKHQVKINLQLGNWFNKLKKNNQFEMIISNPPYISTNDKLEVQNSTRFEPKKALFSKDDGLADIKIIINQAKNYLTNGGYLLLEHSNSQQEKIETRLIRENYQNIIKLKDRDNQPRVTIAQFIS